MSTTTSPDGRPVTTPTLADGHCRHHDSITRASVDASRSPRVVRGCLPGDEQSARLMGLDVARTRVLVYVISGVCSGLGGLVLTAYSGAGYPRNGIGTELDVIAAVVIGGTSLFGGIGTIFGTVVGTLLIGVLLNGLVLNNVSSYVQQVIIGVIIVLAVAFDTFAKSRRKRA